MHRMPSVVLKATESNSSLDKYSGTTKLTPFRGRQFLLGALLHSWAKWLCLLQALHTFPNAGHLMRFNFSLESGMGFFLFLLILVASFQWRFRFFSFL